MSDPSEAVIVGAGIAGVSAAFHLAVRRGMRRVVLVDPREPLSLTSARGTEAYRDWWPGFDGAMVDLTSRSIDLLEELAHESGRAFRRSRRGYAYLTGSEEGARRLRARAEAVAGLGAGPLRVHPGAHPYLPSTRQGFAGNPSGADWIEEPEEIRRHLPFVTGEARAMLHVRRAGWLDSRALGRWLLECAELAGVTVLRDRVTGLDTTGGRVRGVELASGERLDTPRVVLAPGPYLAAAMRWLDLDPPANGLTLSNELHGKAAVPDPDGVLPADAPLVVWTDPVDLPWSEDERRRLAADDAGELLGTLPAGVHVRPRGEGAEHHLLIVWTWEDRPADPFDPPWPPRFAAREGEVLLRGLSTVIPGVERYFGRGAEATVDGGYYCKTPDNRPLVGPLPVEGAWVLGALSGFGVMSSQGAAELLAAHLTEAPLPPWAPAFHPRRFADDAYRERMAAWDPAVGEL